MPTAKFLHHLTKQFRPLIEVALPCPCGLCGRVTSRVICTDCEAAYVDCSAHRCRRCALPLAILTSETCGECVRNPPAFDETLVATSYAPPVDQLILMLKFGGQLALAPYFATHIAARTQSALAHNMPDLLIPVPLGRARLVERGFNQAMEIGRIVSSASRIPLVSRAMHRTVETRAQTLLPPDERRKNMLGAFAVAPDCASIFAERHVAVVDDVMTTGETLNAVAVVLKRYGAKRVSNLVFARTAPH